MGRGSGWGGAGQGGSLWKWGMGDKKRDGDDKEEGNGGACEAGKRSVME